MGLGKAGCAAWQRQDPYRESAVLATGIGTEAACLTGRNRAALRH